MEGYGTDAYINARRLGDAKEPNEPFVPSAGHSPAG